MLTDISHVNPNHSQETFSALWSTHHLRIHRCCLKWLNGDQDKAQDAMSLASEKALRYFQSERESVLNIYSWLCKLAYNICIDMHRYQVKQQELINQVSSLPDVFFFSDNCSELLEDKVEREHILSELMQQIAMLPEDLKQAVKYRFLEEMDYPEIASRLNISPDNVRKRVQLARKKLRHSLQH